MPEADPRPVGRPPRAGVAASKAVNVPMTPDELAQLDELRGEEPRAVYLRRCALAPADPSAS